MCPRKESHFFADDELFARLQTHPDRRRKDLAEYLSWFEPIGDRKRLGEASVWSPSSRGSGERIKAFRPNAQVIAMVRNPLSAVPALHSEFVHMGIEPERDLGRALALDGDAGARGRSTRGFPRGHTDPRSALPSRSPPTRISSDATGSTWSCSTTSLATPQWPPADASPTFSRSTRIPPRASGRERQQGSPKQKDPAPREAPSGRPKVVRIVTTESTPRAARSRMSRLNTRNRPRGRSRRQSPGAPSRVERQVAELDGSSVSISTDGSRSRNGSPRAERSRPVAVEMARADGAHFVEAEHPRRPRPACSSRGDPGIAVLSLRGRDLRRAIERRDDLTGDRSPEWPARRQAAVRSAAKA